MARSSDPYASVATRPGLRKTPQTEQADPRQVKNSAGGFTFELDDVARLRRFLVLGSAGGTFYAGTRELALASADVVQRMAVEQPAELLRVILDVSERGAAPKQEPTLFAYALACSLGSDDARKAALAVLPRICRTGTHLFTFLDYVQKHRGWGRGLRRAVAAWYLEKDADALAYQLVKYRQRGGWTHRDVLRRAHPSSIDPAVNALLSWAVGKPADGLPDLVTGFDRLQGEEVDLDQVLSYVRSGAPWEAIPDRFRKERAVADAQVDARMPLGALVRQLPRLTNIGTVGSDRMRTAEVVARISDPEQVRRSRLHPLNLLIAQRTYASGQSMRGDSTWSPSRSVIDGLDAAFYGAFDNVEPTGARHLLALDVSGSMGSLIANMPVSAREASAAMALVTMSVEDDVEVVGFTGRGFGAGRSSGRGWGFMGTGVEPLTISPRQRLDDVVRSVDALPFGSTDCALPILYALAHSKAVDVFIVYTDNETYEGEVHVHEALARYRRTTGIPAKMIVVGMTSTGFSIADPADAGSLDVVGFDPATPAVMADFIRG